LHVAPEAVRVAGCEIGLWRGFVKCQLYATEVGSEGPLAVSPYFRLRDDDVPSPQAGKALSALLDELELRGWRVASEGPRWYQRQLELFAESDDDPLSPSS
jgi:hypothetical protein